MNEAFFLCVDKPAGLTSHDVVAIYRYFLGTRKIGHTGTLDPFATGTLVLAVGRATKLIQYLPPLSKTYQTTIQLGIETETADIEGDIVQQMTVPSLKKEDVQQLVNQKFMGKIIQKPPIYSAIKVKGKRLYEYARQGLSVDIPERQVNIENFTIESVQKPEIQATIRCSKGTYIRSIGVDLATELGTVGHLSQLRRLESDGFDVTTGLTMEELAQIVANTTKWKVALSRGGEEEFPRNDREQIKSDIIERAVRVETALSSLFQWSITSEEAEKTMVGISLPCPSGVEEGQSISLMYQEQCLAIAKKKGGIAKLVRVLQSKA